MLVLTVLLICTLYFSMIAPFVFSDIALVQDILFILFFLVPATNFVYGIIAWHKSNDKRELAKKWKKILTITKIVLIPFYIVNFIAWVLVTIVGIVPVFMYLLVLAPLMGFIFTYWIFLSTVTYSIAIFKEYYNEGYYPKWTLNILLLSQFIFVMDILGIFVLDIIIRKNSKKSKNEVV